ncbi:MAG: citrate lyase subunit alpha [Firmicutes bacterium]|nr:citrate lyase subunit alpha [Bacillota bacterium]
MSKLLKDLKEAIRLSGLKDGMTISFHHHLRNGDRTAVMVLEAARELGIKDLNVNISSVFDTHASFIDMIKEGVITGIETDYMGGAVGKAISSGIMEKPVIFRTHGGRPGDIIRGASHIDVAFVAAPTSDAEGNCTGKMGKSACGSLGYAFADAMYADKTVVITDNLIEGILDKPSISGEYVDYVVAVEKIGEPSGIVSGTTKITKDPVGLVIADYAAKAIEASGLLKDGFSFQTGAGGASLAAAKYLKDIMMEKNIKGSFGLGGITSYMVDMLECGCFEKLYDVQCFDLGAVESIRTNPNHIEITAEKYASPWLEENMVNDLDVVILGATEIDTNFNVNVHTDSNGCIMGGSGGHSDTAAGAKIAMIVAPLSRARISIVTDEVLCKSTPGSTVDVLVTQCGIAVNPLRPELSERFKEAGLPVVDIHDLAEKAKRLNGVPLKPQRGDKVVAEVLYRDGTLLDRIYNVID